MKTLKLHHLISFVCVAGLFTVGYAPAQTQTKAPAAAKSAPATTGGRHITTPKEEFGFNVGDDYEMVNYTKAVEWWKKLASESDRMKLVNIGKTAEGRDQYMSIISSPANIKNLEHFQEISQKLARAEGVTEAQAHELARTGKAVVWIDGGLHASESEGFEQLVEMIYQLVSLNDPETMRFLDDDIILCVAANPDGSEMVANWYMRESDPQKRSMAALPTLYNKYVGHDDNRDSYMSNMPETANMNRQLFIEWFPEIMYNHHQTGPAGAVVFVPPFRDPFNYNFDPLIPLGIEAVGTAMHERLVARGMGGSEMRSGSNYSTWWDGGLRTTVYFHNMIGILTEIIGSPTPSAIPLVADKELPKGDWPLPIAPQVWHYRQSIDYDIQLNRAILDYASRNRETLLFNIWRMGENSIERGSEDYWTITPKRIEALRAAMPAGGGRGGRGGAVPAGGDIAAGGGGGFGRGENEAQSLELYNTILHDPKMRDPRGYIIPADQEDFATATKFVNALLKNGIEVMKANLAFQVEGKSYPAGSFVVKCAQAGRPFILDMFQPQDHPNDLAYPGGPPVPPYDIAGWTLAYQMGVKFDRIQDGFNGPFAMVHGVQPMPTEVISGPANPAGYLISHRVNNSFIVVNHLLKAHATVYWLKSDPHSAGQDLGTGAIWVPAGPGVQAVLHDAVTQLGVPVEAVATAPSGAALKLNPIRVGLYDQYGGNMPAGWLRWLLEQFDFPYELVYPQELDAGNLKDKFDVIVFTDGAFRGGGGGRGGAGGGGRGGRGGAASGPEIPAEYRAMQGNITTANTIPQLKSFLDAGGSIITVGSSTSMAELLGVPVTNALVENGAPLPRDKFYIPGSLMRVTIDTDDPLAYGMPKTADVDFDSSPVFHVGSGGANSVKVAWYDGKETLDSGWALGQAYLDGGVAVVDASVGKGKVFVVGPEVTFRGQPHGTFKLLFNGLYYGSATETNLP
jgi:hypothetical protein